MADYETTLSTDEEKRFQIWKSKFAPKDSGFDYDLRGAFKAGLTPDPRTGHWPDTFKKPNHPTFSNESIYAKQRPELAGKWQGDKYVPPVGGKTMALTNGDEDARRRQSYFPAASRFLGVLEPQQSGTYYHPERYNRQGFSNAELMNITRNLSEVYANDIRFNRAANPLYQTEQDVGTTSTAQFGSGRATPATVQAYIDKYGQPAPGGLVSFATPSGGSIAYRPTRRIRGEGATPMVQPFGDVIGQTNLSSAYKRGYGEPAPTVSGGYVSTRGVATPAELLTPEQRATYGLGGQYGTTFGERFGARHPALSNIGTGLGTIGTLGYNAYTALSRMFSGAPSEYARRQFGTPYDQFTGASTQPRRYFDNY